MNRQHHISAAVKVAAALILTLFLLPASSAQALEHGNPRVYQDLFEHHGSIMMLVDPDSGDIVFANDAASRFYGYSSDELEAKNIGDINALSPEDVEAEYRAAAREDRNFFLFQHRLADGSLRDVEVYSYPVEADGQEYLFSVIIDITERLAAQQALQSRQWTLFAGAILACVLFLGLFLYALQMSRQRKQAAEKLQTDYRFQRLIATLSASFAGMQEEQADQTIHHAIARCSQFLDVDRSYLFRVSEDGTSHSLDYEWLGPGIPSQGTTINGSIDRFPWTYAQLFNKQHVLVSDVSAMPPEASADRGLLSEQGVKSLLLIPIFVRDRLTAVWGFDDLAQSRPWDNDQTALLNVLTRLFEQALERKTAREDLQFWQDLMEYVIRHDPSAIAVHDKDLNYMFVSQHYLDTYRVSEQHVIGKHHYEVFPDIPEKWRRVHQRVLQGETLSADDDRFPRADGSVDYTRWQALPWYSGDGDVGGMVLYTEIINEQKQREQALRDSEERFRMLVETAPDAILVHINKVCVYANQAAVQLLRVSSAEELIGKPSHHWVHPDHLSVVLDRNRVMYEEHQPVPPLEEVFVLADGTELDVEVVAAPIRFDGRDGSLVYVRDITERKEKERKRMEELQERRHQQKLEAIGTLASGVAHEINNPITGIMNYAQLILDETAPDSDEARFAREIVLESQRISGIVRSLLFYSRNEKQSHSPARIEDIIRRTLSLVSVLLNKDQIQVDLDIPEDLPDLKCRSQQIQQVLMNLVTNARDALNERYPGYHTDKQMSISVRLFHRDNRRWLAVTVQDRGPGIPASLHERLFDPFFTTKERGLGTGLGLPISYGIVKEHHGVLRFETKENQYTRFIAELPVDNGWELEDKEN